MSHVRVGGKLFGAPNKSMGMVHMEKLVAPFGSFGECMV